VRVINLSHDPNLPQSTDDIGVEVAGWHSRAGIRTHVLLVVAMALVITIVTALCLLLIRHRLNAQVTDDLSRDLTHSVINFENLQEERVRALDRENSLLAELPTLKSLMTSGDDLTIQDGASTYWQLSGDDLFALADPNGRLVAIYKNGGAVDATLHLGLQELLASPDKHYLIDGRELYVCSLRPLYFGSDETGTLLGYVVSGVSIERTVRQISQPTGVEATFLSNGEVVASTLSPSGQTSLAKQFRLLSGAYRMPLTMTFGNTRFLAATEDLSANATSPLQLLVLKSFEPAERSITRIDRMVLSAGLLALMSGTILMIALSRLVTRPLEELSRSVVAFGVGDGMQRVPGYGTQEVRQLSTAFVSMRKEIQQANQARLESERLATIGRMASSVSHDLRHYLAAIYANAEFLAADRLSVQERSEIFADIRTAVHGTTEMIESLLIFSRTGSSFRRSPESMATLVERAVALVRAHPDAEGISIVTRYEEPTETAAVVDGKQIERAICNLLLNACQALRPIKYAANVTVTVESQDRYIIVNVIDSGQGVPESIRNSLFDPFVSEGKQKGTGLGLTLAHCIAVEHGGEVVLISSRPGETIFSMTIARDLQSQGPLASSETSRHDKAIDHEKLRF
jgi:signal transduction histidine kinase